MDHQEVINRIKQVAERVLPKGSTLYLYGSRARGDYKADSDWDLLVLLDKPERDTKDWDNYAWPFTEMGWDIEEQPVPSEEDGLDSELIRRLAQLTPDEVAKVDAFVQGILAMRGE